MPTFYSVSNPRPRPSYGLGLFFALAIAGCVSRRSHIKAVDEAYERGTEGMKECLNRVMQLNQEHQQVLDALQAEIHEKDERLRKFNQLDQKGRLKAPRKANNH